MKKISVTQKLFDYDCGFSAAYIAGMDEAGRGPLAGPVVAAACVMPEKGFIDGVNDSKKLPENKRERLFEQIKAAAEDFCISVISVEDIDRINILNATKKAMLECLFGLKKPPELVLIDAVRLDCPFNIRPIIKGDAQSYSIAAASVLAKVTRDRIMREYAEVYPQYGFERNKGYGTAYHIEMLKKFGACPLHRKTFIKNILSSETDPCQEDFLVDD